ncbi:helix-turn-helix domain-containing protein [Inconstantimicrobium mannanitabidum]|uniref:Transcriptional regulator n=1 Tax=Inconstantimicrobium mannanitabidum TaxID=1604901 RepID=A0ACB5RCY1_9CLOT|nr:helix-turn-helix transcriptional regulator [Clostridium sp. TW13]GKX66956.1 transcriptional regulator [Clostridium sp. TW13]
MEILSLGEKIKKRRKELNMTLKDLAGERITPGQISLVESGRSNPSMDLLEYLASTLNTSIEYLMESEETQANKICTYYEQIAQGYIWEENISTGEKYLEEGLFYAEKYNLENRIAKIQYMKAEICVSKEQYFDAQQLFLSSNGLFIKNNDYENVVKTFLSLGKVTIEMKAYHSSISYLSQAESVYQQNQLGYEALLAEIYFCKAVTYYRINEMDKAINYSFLAKEKFGKLYNKKEYARTLLLISEQYSEEGDFEKAIDYSKRALKEYAKMRDDENISDIENNLGRLFFNFENLEESFIHYNRAKEIRSKNNDKKLIDTLMDLFENYIRQKDLIKCTSVINELDKIIGSDDIVNLVKLHIIKFRICIANNNNDDAELILNEAYKMAKANGLTQEAADLAVKLGKFYLDQQKDAEAAEFLGEGISLFKEMGIIKDWM